MLIPASGPTPGSMPTSVPITQPTNAYTSIEGWSATEKPSMRLLNVSAISKVTGSSGEKVMITGDDY